MVNFDWAGSILVHYARHLGRVVNVPEKNLDYYVELP